MNTHEAKDIVISIFNSSSYRKTTETEKKHIREITKKFGDQFVQSCYVEAATKRIKQIDMKNKKYKVKIPEGMKVKRTFTNHTTGGLTRTTVEFEPIKKELPKTWEEYCSIYGYPPSWMVDSGTPERYKALAKLEILRDHYNATEIESNPYSIYKVGNGFASTNNTTNRGPIVLNSTKLGIEFAKNFRDLIIEALPLL